MLSVSEFVIVNPNSLVYEFDDLTNTLEQNEISYAVAPYWSANVVSVLSEGTVLVQPCNIENGSLVQSDISTLSLYEDKATTFRTVVSSVSQNESFQKTLLEYTDIRRSRLRQTSIIMCMYMIMMSE